MIDFTNCKRSQREAEKQTVPDREEKSDQRPSVLAALHQAQENIKYASDEEVMAISDRLMKQHQKAYGELAK